ncbi:MAG TPA: TVP38/TMEM64 family protein, partial [Candidatus Saccharimonadia bacterium]|nr:TVP38/TMEM64 family protein [Candidatus Saccharimonadia bacterium]
MTRPSTPVAKPFAWRRLLPILVFVAGLVAFFALGLERYLSIDALRQHRSVLRAWVEMSGLLAALVFMAVYIVTVAFSLPGATVLSIAGGFLFGSVWGTVLVIISATLGATILFSIA